MQAVNPLNTLMNNPNDNSILGRVVRITDQVIFYRQWIRENFSLAQDQDPVDDDGNCASGSHPLDDIKPRDQSTHPLDCTLKLGSYATNQARGNRKRSHRVKRSDSAPNDQTNVCKYDNSVPLRNSPALKSSVRYDQAEEVAIVDDNDSDIVVVSETGSADGQQVQILEDTRLVSRPATSGIRRYKPLPSNNSLPINDRPSRKKPTKRRN